MSEEILIIMKEEIAKSITDTLPPILKEKLTPILQEKVNGKIDRIKEMLDVQNKDAENTKEILRLHNERHEADMKRIMPVILAYEYSERRVEDAQNTGWAAMKVAAFITAIGSAVIITRTLFKI